jgi:hypothetical protein
MSPIYLLGLLVSAYVIQITRNPLLGFSRQGAVVARLVGVLRPTCAQYKGFSTLQAHPPSYDTGSRRPQCLRLPAHFPLICVSRVSEPGCSREDREKGGGAFMRLCVYGRGLFFVTSFRLVPPPGGGAVMPTVCIWQWSRMQSRLSRKPCERSAGGSFFDEALRRVDRLYAEEIAGRSPWSVTLLGDRSG